MLAGFREAADPRFIADVARCEVLVENVGGKIAAIAELVDTLEARAQIPQIEIAAGDDRLQRIAWHPGNRRNLQRRAQDVRGQRLEPRG